MAATVARSRSAGPSDVALAVVDARRAARRARSPSSVAAVTDAGVPLAIIAAAGSGKTTVLTRRIAHRIADGSPTCTPARARADLHQRGGARAAAPAAPARTPRPDRGRARSTPWRCAAPRARALDNRPTPRRRGRVRSHAADRRGADRATSSRASSRAVRARRPRLGPGPAGRPPTRYGDAPQRRPAPQCARRRRGSQRRRRRYAASSAGAASSTSTTCSSTASTAMRTDTLWAAGVRWRFRHLFVDEAQDLNPLQHALLEAIRDGRPDSAWSATRARRSSASTAPTRRSCDRRRAAATRRHRRRARGQLPLLAADRRAPARRCSSSAEQVDDTVAVAADGAAVAVVDAADERARGAQRRGAASASTSAPAAVAQLRRAGPHHRAAHAMSPARLARAGVPTPIAGPVGQRAVALGCGVAEAYAQRNRRRSRRVDRSGDRRGRDRSDASAVWPRRPTASSPSGTGLTFRAWVELHTPFDDLEPTEADDAVDAVDLPRGQGPGVAGRRRHRRRGGPRPALLARSRRRSATRRPGCCTSRCTRPRGARHHAGRERRNGRAGEPSPLIADIAPTRQPTIVGAPPCRATAAADARSGLRRAASSGGGRGRRGGAGRAGDDLLRRVAARCSPRPARPRRGVAALTDLGPIAAAAVAPRLLAALNRAV